MYVLTSNMWKIETFMSWWESQSRELEIPNYIFSFSHNLPQYIINDILYVNLSLLSLHNHMSGWPMLCSLNIELKWSSAALGTLKDFHLNFDCNMFMRHMFSIPWVKTFFQFLIFIKKRQNIIKQWVWEKNKQTNNGILFKSVQKWSNPNRKWERNIGSQRPLGRLPRTCVKIFAMLY